MEEVWKVDKTHFFFCKCKTGIRVMITLKGVSEEIRFDDKRDDVCVVLMSEHHCLTLNGKLREVGDLTKLAANTATIRTFSENPSLDI